MRYPLTEKIGHPELLVGRQKEFRLFDKWLKNIPEQLSKSRVILARRKSGKTVFVQRIFNRLWSENGEVIPFYFDFAERDIWFPDFAIKYYCTFVSQYISFLERDEKLVNTPLLLEDIKEYGLTNAIKFLVKEVDFLLQNKEAGRSHDLMWDIAHSAPHRFADLFDKRFLVILDEFQNITQYIYRDENCSGKPDETLAGSFHYYSESKIAPMLVTGSYIGWLLNVIRKYLEAGRLKKTHMSPYLTEEEGLQAVYKYAQFYEEPITNETAIQINELCMADAFFISCVIQSDYENKDLTTSAGVAETVNYEISDRESEMSETWNEYLQQTLEDVNNIHGKNILLFLNKHADRYWTPRELKDDLHIDLAVNEIQKRLLALSQADLIERGASNIKFRGLTDGTLNLILRHRLEEEITDFAPDLKQEFRTKLEQDSGAENRKQGKLNQLSGEFAEYQLATAFRLKKQFALSQFFQQPVADNSRLNLTNVKQRFYVPSVEGDGLEIDIVAESSCGRVVLVEVKKRQKKSNKEMVEEFWEKVEAYQNAFPDKKVLPAFLSLGGFTKDAKPFCEKLGISIAERIEHY